MLLICYSYPKTSCDNGHKLKKKLDLYFNFVVCLYIFLCFLALSGMRLDTKICEFISAQSIYVSIVVMLLG